MFVGVWRSISVLVLLSLGCDKSSDSSDKASGEAALAFEASGTIEIDGKPRTAKSCAISGSGADTVLSLTLDEGPAIKLPIHEGGASIGSAKLECTESNLDGEGSGQHFHGSIERDCGRLKLKLTMKCGTAGPSNRSPDDKPPAD